MSRQSPSSAITTALLTLFVAGAAFARPPEISASDSDDDATVELFVPAQTILGDVRSQCRVHIDVAEADVAFTDGDHAYVYVYEDDLLGDDLLWQTDFAVARADLRGGRLVRDFDCSSAFGADGVGTLEIYAQLLVEKSECGAFCFYDEPTTANLSLEEMEDDAFEDDDAANAARPAGLGLNANRISRDQDWFSIELQSRSRIAFRAEHTPGAGRLDVLLLDDDGGQIAVGQDAVDATEVVFEPIDPGTVRVRVSPREGGDFNFYDGRLTVDTLASDCGPNEEESEACGACGQRVRRCDQNGRWTPFGACEGEGVCVPDATRQSPCGRCGEAVETCTAACAWGASSVCEGEGMCDPMAEDEEDCADGGTRVRTCGPECAWGAFTACGGMECPAGMMRECYTGPPSTRSVGTCRPGRQNCIGGRWGGCEEEVTPTIEACDNRVDDDCDGDADADDMSCAGQPNVANVGDACAENVDCGQFACLRAPNHPQFEGGYCGVVPCNAACGEGTDCVSLFGRQYCLRSCQQARDCRSGYACLEVALNHRVCAPACNDDSDCADARAPVCDHDTGLCVATSDERVDMGAGMNPPRRDSGVMLPPPPSSPGSSARADAGAGPGELSSKEEGCACNTQLSGRGSVWPLLLGIGLLGLSRRRRPIR